MIRVALVDDDPLARSGLSMAISSDPDIEVVGEADDGDGALAVVTSHAPDIVVMDVNMARVDGIEATLRIREGLPNPPRVIVLTSFEDEENIFRSLQAGASGFLVKRSTQTELIEAIHQVADGAALLSPKATRKVIERFVGGGGASTVDADSLLGRLTDREREIFELVAKGLNNVEIAKALSISPNTAKSHIGRLLTKLDVGDRAQAVVLAYESGLVQPGGG